MLKEDGVCAFRPISICVMNSDKFLTGKKPSDAVLMFHGSFTDNCS
jgi:hypothetical protein